MGVQATSILDILYPYNTTNTRMITEMQPIDLGIQGHGGKHPTGYTKDCHVHAFLDVNDFHGMFGAEVTSFVGCSRVPRSWSTGSA